MEKLGAVTLLLLTSIVLVPLSLYLYRCIRLDGSFIESYSPRFDEFRSGMYKTVVKKLDELQGVDGDTRRQIQKHKTHLADLFILDAFNNSDCVVKNAPVSKKLLATALENIRWLKEDFLKLSDAKLHTIPVEAMEILPALENINLANTGIYYGVERMSVLNSLETLNLSSNGLRRIPDFSQFKRLRVVHLDSNPIRIPDVSKIKGNKNIGLITFLKVAGISAYEDALRARFGYVELS